MSFTSNQPPPFIQLQYTSGVLLLTILVLFTVSSVISFPSKGGHECPNCGEEYIKTISASTGKCVECWHCPECNDGTGLSVACPSNITVGTEIHCVQCFRGANFSDSPGTGQCQPCGVCSGKHEHVLHECTPESDVKCDCDAGFYRNKTTKECLPCGSCSGCSNDDEISSKCKENEEHPKPWPSTYGTSLSTDAGSNNGPTVVKSCSTVLATSSSLVASSYLHATSTPKLLLGYTNMPPVPSRTQQIQATSTSVSEWSKNELTPTQSPAHVIQQNIHKTVNPGILIAVLTVVCVFILICVCGFLYYKFKKLRKRRWIGDQRKRIKFSELQQNEGNRVCCEEVKSPGSCDVNVHVENAHEIACEEEDNVLGLSAMYASEDLNKTVDSVQDGRGLVSDQFKHTGGSEKVQKGIPPSSSLEGLVTRNPIARDDEGDLTIASVDGKMIPSGDPLPSAGTVNVFLNFNPGNIEQMSDPSQRAALPPFPELTSHGNNLAMSGMPLANSQGAICTCGLTSVAAPAVQSTEGNRGHPTHITHVPLPVIHKMCMLLNLEREIDENDYRMFGNELGLDSLQISTLKQKCNNPSNVLLLQVFPAMPNSGTLEHLIPILTKMGRHDVLQVIDEWVGSQNCTQAAQVY